MGTSCSSLPLPADAEKDGNSSAAGGSSDFLPIEKSKSLSGERQTPILAEEVERECLESKLKGALVKCPDSEIRETFTKTVMTCVDRIVNGVGGVIIVVAHEELLETKLELEPLDGGTLHEVMQSIADNVEQDSFKKMLNALTAHSASDRWDHGDIITLVSELESAADHAGRLEGQPKDGALLISHKGDVKGASLHIKYKSKRLVMKKADGTSAGTRHASSLGMAEWLGTVDIPCPGLVFTRSDGGGAHCFIPKPREAPAVFHFKTIHHLTQEEMLELFRDRMKRYGKLMLKREPSLVRPGQRGEQVVTVVGGRVTSNVTIQDDTSFVVQASTPDQEHYVLSAVKFNTNYEPNGIDVDEGDMFIGNNFMRVQARHLKSKGFKLYKPRPNNRRWVYVVTSEDLHEMGINSFEASWGAIQPVREGDYLACGYPLEEATEIYLMPAEVVGTYKEVHTAQDDAKSGAHINGDDKAPLTQIQMLQTFGQKIKEQGQIMFKTAHAIIRPAVLNETIVTCVSGRVISYTKVADETSKVVKGEHHELYVLSLEKFEANYEPEGLAITGKSSIDKLLVSQGYRRYRAKATPKIFYKITAADAASVPNGFETTFGSLQEVHEGDYLVMPDGQSKQEVYMMPADKITSYSAGRSTRSSLSGMMHLIQTGSKNM